MQAPWQIAAGATLQTGRVWPLVLIVLALMSGYAWWYLAPDTMPDAIRKELPRSDRSNPVL